MKDFTEQIYDELNAQVVRMLDDSMKKTARIVEQATCIAELERQLQDHSAQAFSIGETYASALLRIAELEAQIAAASAPAVKQQPAANDGWLIDGSLVYKFDPTNTMNAFEINVTQAEGSRKNDGPRVELAKRILAWITAPQSADTDKLRDAILALRVDPPRHYDTAQIFAFCLGARMMSEAAAKQIASTALQAPVREVPGWQLVPIEPTDEMRAACINACYSDHIDEDWKAMLAAVPLPAAPVQEPKP